MEVMEMIKYSAALTLAGVLLFLFVGGLSYFKTANLTPLVLTGVDSQEIRIHLEEVKYMDEVTGEIAGTNQEIGKLLEEIIL
jgi:hypothetical protein